MREYHDTEWGVPERDSRALWEALVLDGFQAGLSWITILRKREAFREEFRGFDPRVVSELGEKGIVHALANPGIVRSRAKIEATVANARAFLKMEADGESFSCGTRTAVSAREASSNRPVVWRRRTCSGRVAIWVRSTAA